MFHFEKEAIGHFLICFAHFVNYVTQCEIFLKDMYDSQMEERRAKIIEERSMYYLDSNVKKTILALLDRSFVL